MNCTSSAPQKKKSNAEPFMRDLAHTCVRREGRRLIEYPKAPANGRGFLSLRMAGNTDIFPEMRRFAVLREYRVKLLRQMKEKISCLSYADKFPKLCVREAKTDNSMEKTEKLAVHRGHASKKMQRCGNFLATLHKSLVDKTQKTDKISVRL